MSKVFINIYCNEPGEVKIIEECEQCEDEVDVEDVLEDDAEDVTQRARVFVRLIQHRYWMKKVNTPLS